MSKKYFIFLIIFILIFSAKTFSWWSAVILRESTHHKLTRMAIEQIDGIEYPDIKRFGDDIANWTSGPGDDNNAHGKKYEKEYGENAGKFNGGPYEFWWQHPTKPDGVLIQYKLHNFINGDYSAYYYLAIMCHLIADQAVPAHASNILHAYPAKDHLEEQANTEPPQRGGTIIKNDTTVLDLLKRYYFYKNENTQERDGSIHETQLNLPNWKSSNDRYYWLENSTKYEGNAFDSVWGKYGGENNEDIYDEGTDNQDIIQTQFSQSVAYMAGFLRSASEKLPPLVSNLALDTAVVNYDTGVIISFRIQENRTPNVRIKITVDNKAIENTEKVWDGTTENYLIWNSDLQTLPYHGNLEIKWSGLLADGSYISEGQHNIVVSVQDVDGNWSDESVKDIIFSQPIQIIKSRRPTFIATIDENVDKSSLKIIIDGVVYGPFTYDFSIGKMVYKPDFNLEFGIHQFKQIGTDITGNVLETPTYTFKIEPTEIIFEDIYPSNGAVINTSRPTFRGKIRIK